MSEQSFGDRRFGPRKILTPELAKNDPNQYKENLFQVMEQNAPLAHEVIIKLHEKGIWTPEQLTLLTGPGQMSGFDIASHEIELDTQPLPADKKSADIFEDSRFEGDMEIVYVFNHELSHLISKLAILDEIANPEVSEEISAMTEAFLDMRKHEPGLALTRQGAVESYKHDAAEEGLSEGSLQALEDIAELINMFILDPNYLKSYLDFLSHPAYRDQRKHLNLKSVSPDVAEDILGGIARCVKALLDS